MPEPLAHYSFISWQKRGLGSKISEEDRLGNDVSGDDHATERATIDVELVVKHNKISGGSDEDVISKSINIIGPADINGINPKAILRTEPVSNVNNFEANLLAYIEFYEEDFPWRYSPVAPPSSSADAAKLRPWISLIVLEESEFELSDNGIGLSSISITDTALNTVFCSHLQTWAWAHVHVNQSLTADNTAGEVDELLANDPDIGHSRVLCPRKLQKNKDYTAFLIPTFEVGRLAGLGQETASVKAQAAAWKKDNDSVTINDVAGFEKNTFPFYYQWKFRTGKLGDFETLVSVLKPFPSDPESGKMPMDIANPGYDLDGKASSSLLGFEGALKPPGFEPAPFPLGRGDDDFIIRLRELLNLSIEASADDNDIILDSDNPFYDGTFREDPIVVPPIYGYWHAMIQKLSHTNPSWIQELNLDPRKRGAAGLGTQTTIKNQEQYIHRAWQQIGAVNEANQKIREAELSMMVNKSVYRKHLENTDDDQFAQLTAGMQRRMRDISNLQTVYKKFQASRIPKAVRTTTFRRIIRPEKKSNRRIHQSNPDLQRIHKSVISNFNSGNSTQEDPQITAAKIKRPGLNALETGAISNAIESAKNNYLQEDIFLVRDLLFLSIESAELDTLDQALIKSKINEIGGIYEGLREDHPARWASLKSAVEEAIDQISAYNKDEDSEQIAVKLDANKHKALFTGVESNNAQPPSHKAYKKVVLYRDLNDDEAERTSKATTLADVVAFQNSFNDFTSLGNRPSFVNSSLRPVMDDLNETYSFIRENLRPEKTLPAKIIRNMKIWKDGSYQPLEEMKQVMAYPEFTEAVYEELRSISQNFILPNVEKLPRNSLTILTINQPFIESYLAGMNHEMARELLWREYPTDQRGSYFRQFWDTRDDLFETDEDKKKDIIEMHKWQSELGEHKANPAAGNLVLVVRGDLFLKYPGTIIYAQKAEYDPSDPSLPRLLPSDITESNTLFPTFSAELEPDIFLFGFSLTVDEAKGERAESDSTVTTYMNPGWFFVFRERPGQVKFGLDDFVDEQGNSDVIPDQDGNLESWNDLSWEHLVENKEKLNEYILDLDTPVPPVVPSVNSPTPSWGANAADMASILYQNPVIFARHSSEML